LPCIPQAIRMSALRLRRHARTTPNALFATVETDLSAAAKDDYPRYVFGGRGR